VASYSVLIKTSAAKELEAVEPRGLRIRIVSRIRSLARAPRPSGSQKLAGESARYRIRQGAYRIVYSVDDEGRIVEVVKIGHRREVYRQRPPVEREALRQPGS
jgi:mRNA interferase RelE/StbE